MAKLDLYRGDQHLLSQPLRKHGRTLFGRSDDADLAIPGPSISQRHFYVDHVDDKYFLVDCSAHGILLNGTRPPHREPVELHHGDRIVWDADGMYAVADVRPNRNFKTPTGDRMFTLQEALVEAVDHDVTVLKAQIEFVGGPHAGSEVFLDAPRVSVGGPDDTLALPGCPGPTLFSVHVVYGRPLIVPGKVPVYVDGQRIETACPIYSSDVAVCGDHRFKVRRRLIRNAAEQRSERFGDYSAVSDEAIRFIASCAKVAPFDDPVLIIGETGTGKELVARGIHARSGRRGRFVPLNMGEGPEQLLEARLFGQEKGAFTGADARTDGAVHYANGGTVFLDEIGELGSTGQARLLRFLETGEVRRLGANEVEYPNVRIVAATHRNLPRMIRKGLFRMDLFQRLDVLRLGPPALRRCPEDIVRLAREFARNRDPRMELTDRAIAALVAHPWPGNIRELRNVISRSAVLTDELVLDALDLEFQEGVFPPSELDEADDGGPDDPAQEIADLLGALNAPDGSIAVVSQQRGVKKSTMQSRLDRMGIVRRDGRWVYDPAARR